MKIYYGVPHFYKDITELCYTKCLNQDLFIFPNEDTKRSSIFGDPIYGVIKHILVVIDNRLKIFKNNDMFALSLQDFYNHSIDLINPYDLYVKEENIKNINDFLEYIFLKNNFKTLEKKIEYDEFLIKKGYICIMNIPFSNKNEYSECELVYFQIWKKI